MSVQSYPRLIIHRKMITGIIQKSGIECAKNK